MLLYLLKTSLFVSLRKVYSLKGLLRLAFFRKNSGVRVTPLLLAAVRLCCVFCTTAHTGISICHSYYSLSGDLRFPLSPPYDGYAVCVPRMSNNLVFFFLLKTHLFDPLRQVYSPICLPQIIGFLSQKSRVRANPTFVGSSSRLLCFSDHFFMKKH